MKRWIVILALLALFGAAAEQSHAMIGFYAGAYGGVSSQKFSFSDVKFDRDTSFLYGLRLGLQVAMIAAEVTYYRAGHNVAMSDFYLFNWDGLEDDLSYIGANVRLMFPALIFRPFLSLGYGFYTADIQNIDKDTEGGANFGAGLEIKLGKLAIIGEGKFNKVTFSLDDLAVGLSHFTLTAGLNFYF
jgi:hypothetical protein